MSERTLKYKDTKCREIDLSEMETSLGVEGEMTSWRSNSFKSGMFRSNYGWIENDDSQKVKPKYFILDGNDNNWIRQNVEVGKAEKDCLESLEQFLKIQPNKRIYIRSMPSSVLNESERIVFTDEVFNIIPLVLKQQNTPLKASDRRLEKVRGLDRLKRVTISMWEFEEVLNSFDVNKDLITIMPDVVYELTKQEMLERGVNPIRVIGLNGDMMINTSQAILQIFQSVVCGVNWNLEFCKKHKNCKEAFRKTIINVMLKYFNKPPLTFEPLEHVEESIKTLKKHCTYGHQKDLQMKPNYPDHALQSFKHMDNISSETYRIACHTFGLDMLEDFSANEQVPVSKARVYYATAWIRQFLRNEQNQLGQNIWLSLVQKAPISDSQKSQMVALGILRDSQPSHESPISPKTDDANVPNKAVSEQKGVSNSSEGTKKDADVETEKDPFEKMRADAERRKMEIQNKKKAKKGQKVPVFSTDAEIEEQFKMWETKRLSPDVEAKISQFSDQQIPKEEAIQMVKMTEMILAGAYDPSQPMDSLLNRIALERVYGSSKSSTFPSSSSQSSSKTSCEKTSKSAKNPSSKIPDPGFQTNLKTSELIQNSVETVTESSENIEKVSANAGISLESLNVGNDERSTTKIGSTMNPKESEPNIPNKNLENIEKTLDQVAEKPKAMQTLIDEVVQMEPTVLLKTLEHRKTSIDNSEQPIQKLNLPEKLTSSKEQMVQKPTPATLESRMAKLSLQAEDTGRLNLPSSSELQTYRETLNENKPTSSESNGTSGVTMLPTGSFKPNSKIVCDKKPTDIDRNPKSKILNSEVQTAQNCLTNSVPTSSEVDGDTTALKSVTMQVVKQGNIYHILDNSKPNPEQPKLESKTSTILEKGSKDEEKLKESNEIIPDSNTQLIDYISELEAQLKRERQRTDRLEQEIVQLRQKSENDQMDFATRLSQMEMKISNNGKTIEDFQAKMSQPTAKCSRTNTKECTVNDMRDSTTRGSSSSQTSSRTDDVNVSNETISEQKGVSKSSAESKDNAVVKVENDPFEKMRADAERRKKELQKKKNAKKGRKFPVFSTDTEIEEELRSCETRKLPPDVEAQLSMFSEQKMPMEEAIRMVKMTESFLASSFDPCKPTNSKSNKIALAKLASQGIRTTSYTIPISSLQSSSCEKKPKTSETSKNPKSKIPETNLKTSELTQNSAKTVTESSENIKKVSAHAAISLKSSNVGNVERSITKIDFEMNPNESKMQINNSEDTGNTLDDAPKKQKSMQELIDEVVKMDPSKLVNKPIQKDQKSKPTTSEFKMVEDSRKVILPSCSELQTYLETLNEKKLSESNGTSGAIKPTDFFKPSSKTLCDKKPKDSGTNGDTIALKPVTMQVVKNGNKYNIFDKKLNQSQQNLDVKLDSKKSNNLEDDESVTSSESDDDSSSLPDYDYDPKEVVQKNANDSKLTSSEADRINTSLESNDVKVVKHGKKYHLGDNSKPTSSELNKIISVKTYLDNSYKSVLMANGTRWYYFVNGNTETLIPRGCMRNTMKRTKVTKPQHLKDLEELLKDLDDEMDFLDTCDEDSDEEPDQKLKDQLFQVYWEVKLGIHEIQKVMKKLMDAKIDVADLSDSDQSKMRLLLELEKDKSIFLEKAENTMKLKTKKDVLQFLKQLTTFSKRTTEAVRMLKETPILLPTSELNGYSDITLPSSEVQQTQKRFGEEKPSTSESSKMPTEKLPQQENDPKKITSSNSESRSSSKNSSIQKSTTTDIDKYSSFNILNPQKDNQKKDKNTEKKKESVTKVEPTIQKKEEKSSSNESKSCPKCLRTSERCSDAQRELKTAENKLKKIEDKARKFDEIEKKMKEMTKENDELNKINSQQAKEIESLELKGSKEGEKLKGANKKLIDYVSDLEAQLQSERQKTNALEREIAQFRQKSEDDQMKFSSKLSQIEVEISNNGATIEELRNANLRMSIRNDEQERIINQLYDRLTPTSSEPSSSTKLSTSSIPSTSSASSTSSGPSASTRADSDYEKSLKDIQNLQNGFNDGSVMREAEGIVEHLMTLTNRPETHQLARDELTQLDAKIKNYLRAVKKNIWILERTRNASKLERLPERPSLSDRFMAEYRMAVANQQYSETECHICSYEMTPQTKTSQCRKCKKIDCAKCISECLKNRSTCPHCRAPRLDENEFPALR